MLDNHPGRPTADFQKFQKRDWKKFSTNSYSKSLNIAEQFSKIQGPSLVLTH